VLSFEEAGALLGEGALSLFDDDPCLGTRDFVVVLSVENDAECAEEVQQFTLVKEVLGIGRAKSVLDLAFCVGFHKKPALGFERFHEYR